MGKSLIKNNDYILCLMIVLGFFAHKTSIQHLERETEFLRNSLISLEDELVECLLNSEKVTATIYYAVPSQTDKDPHITADGTRLHKRYVDKYRFLAVSRDLLKENGGFLEYGDYVIIENTNGRYNGIWQVKDTMNKRFTKRIDFLVDKKTPHNKFEDVSLIKVVL